MIKTQIVALLTELNTLVDGKLISVDVVAYVDKIFAKSTMLISTSEDVLNGFISYYDNDETKEIAFLTMLAINPRAQRLGYGKLLLQFSIDSLQKKGFKYFELEVLKDNIKAIKIYENFDFEVVEVVNSTVIMRKKL